MNAAKTNETPVPTPKQTPTPSTTPNKNAVAKTDERSLEELEKEAEALNAQLKKIEELKGARKAAEATAAFDELLKGVQKFKDFLTDAQKAQLIGALGGKVGKGGKGGNTGKNTTKSKAAYQLPSGDTYGGKGPTPQAFKDWAESAEGKKWREQNPGQKWPAAQ